MSNTRGACSHSILAILFTLLLQLQPHHSNAQQQRYDYPTAKPSTSWTNTNNLPHTIAYPDGTTIKSLLLRSPPTIFGPSFATGFYCRTPNPTTSPCTDFLFAVFIVYTNSGAGITMANLGIPQVVWSANRNRPVKLNAVLQFTAAGDLVLKDADGTLVWSTGTAGKSAVSLSIADTGNLILADAKGATVWQSFDHPTDTLLPGQRLYDGQSLIANVSGYNYREGLISLAATSSGFRAFVRSAPAQTYFIDGAADGAGRRPTRNYLVFQNGSLSFFQAGSSQPSSTRVLPTGSSLQYLRLELDGHLRVYQWGTGSVGWSAVADVIGFYGVGNCGFPTVCGSYGICSAGQCSCPRDASNRMVNHFLPVSDRHPNLGCDPVVPVSCRDTRLHRLLRFDDMSYFGYVDSSFKVNVKKIDDCASACLRQCGCRGAFFQYGSDPTNGICYLVPRVFSMIDHDRELMHFNSTAFVKVQVR